MAKKVRRVRPATSRPTGRSAVMPERAPVEPARPVMTRREVTAEEFKEEYAYVLRDLRRVFALAAVMFLLLIVLNVVLR